MLKFFVWPPITQSYGWLKELSSIKKKGVLWDTLMLAHQKMVDCATPIVKIPKGLVIFVNLGKPDFLCCTIAPKILFSGISSSVKSVVCFHRAGLVWFGLVVCFHRAGLVDQTFDRLSPTLPIVQLLSLISAGIKSSWTRGRYDWKQPHQKWNHDQHYHRYQESWFRIILRLLCFTAGLSPGWSP